MTSPDESSPHVSISAEEYFAYKTEKLKSEIEERAQYRLRRFLAISIFAFFVIVVAYSSWSFAQIQEQISFFAESSNKARKSEFLLEEALQRLEINSRDSETVLKEIQLLRKEVLSLRLRVEKLEASSSNKGLEGGKNE